MVIQESSKAEVLWVAEHGRIFRGVQNRCLENGDLELSPEDFVACLSLLDTPDSTDVDLEPVMSYSRPYGREQLKVANHVGVIRTERGTQIEILPKISKRTDVTAARQLLLKMLMALEDSPFRMGTSADLAAHRMPLFEILLGLFLQQVASIVRKGIARDYTEHEDNLFFVRGKICLAQHIRKNAVLADRVWCRFDEFEINRPINRLVRGALDVVSRLTRDSNNQQLCRELLFWFDRVPPTRSPANDLRRVRKDRLIRHYEPAMPLCRLILERLNPLTQQGSRRALSVLFPMETIFENYVASKLPRQLPDWRVSTQVSGHALVESHGDRSIFRLIPDLALRQGDQVVIADTKWKLLDSADRSNKYGISQADIYQLFAYTKKYLRGQVWREVYLIYPMTDSFRQPLKPFWYSQDQEVLWVLPFDLERDQLVIDSSCLLERAKARNKSDPDVDTRKCSRCGAGGELALVTLRYSRHAPGGRILVYCPRCRENSAPQIRVCIALDAVTDEIFLALYRTGKTESDPATAVDIVFGKGRPDLVSAATLILAPD